MIAVLITHCMIVKRRIGGDGRTCIIPAISDGGAERLCSVDKNIRLHSCKGSGRMKVTVLERPQIQNFPHGLRSSVRLKYCAVLGLFILAYAWTESSEKARIFGVESGFL